MIYVACVYLCDSTPMLESQLRLTITAGVHKHLITSYCNCYVYIIHEAYSNGFLKPLLADVISICEYSSCNKK